jgi:HK97 family phage major capsid protein
VQGLNENGVIRPHSRVITTSGGLHKIPVVASHGSASWIDEEGDYIESDESFGQVQLDAHKVGTVIKVSEELLQDSAFDLESYMSAEFSRRIGDKEEDAFLNGNGSGKPTGILNATGGGSLGVTAAGGTAITADELVDLYYSLKATYRKNAVWILNDATIKLIRKLKTGDGQYLWQPGIKDGEQNTILGRPYFTSPFMPIAAAGAKTIIFGDLSYYWIGDRQGITFRRLNELYAGKGQVGFMASKRLDGKTVLPEAIKFLQQHA